MSIYDKVKKRQYNEIIDEINYAHFSKKRRVIRNWRLQRKSFAYSSDWIFVDKNPPTNEDYRNYQEIGINKGLLLMDDDDDFDWLKE